MNRTSKRESALLRKLPFARWQFLGFVVGLYVITYFALMKRSEPAVELYKVSHRIWFQSSFRFAPTVDGYARSTAWNYFYLPLDKLYFRAFPSHRKYGGHGFIEEAL